MRIKFEYPMATEENMKAVQAAIDAGMKTAELLDSFLEEVVWDCVVVLSGNEDTPWAVLGNMEGNRQTVIEDWQCDVIDDYIAKSLTLKSKATVGDNVYFAIGIQDKVLLITDRNNDDDDYGWDYRLLYIDGNEIDAGGVYESYDKSLGEMIEEILKEYYLPSDCNWKLCDYDYYLDMP